MCGIVGFCGAGDPALLTRMMDALQHRGPDGRGTFVHPETRIHLGHLRLAILDLAGGVQPMWNEDHTVAIIFNGEIYNHAELRKELLALGHRFVTDHSDTEALVHGYEEWKEALLPRLNGMFAFAVADFRRRELFLARDRFGEKPLVYTHQDGTFAFASEVTALRRHPVLRIEPDELSVQKFLACGFLTSPRSYFRAVHRLPPGHHLTVPFGRPPPAPRSYWTFRVEPEAAWIGRSDADLAEEFTAHLQRAVQRRLLSDVPLGVFLSGGLDSGAITSLAAQAVPAGQLETFTIGFDEPSYDERVHAGTVAAHCESRHYEEVLRLADARELMDSVLQRMDEPIADPSILPTYLLSRFTRTKVTVALSGDGGDELLAGYDPFRALGPAVRLSRLVPPVLWRGLRRVAERLPQSDRNMSLDFKVRRTLGGLVRPMEQWNPAWLGPVAPEEIARLFERPLPPEELFAEPIALWNSRPDLTVEERTLEFYTRFYLTENILFKVDRAAMLNSLESRAVFLDNDLVDFCRRLPLRQKMRGGRTKFILRRMLAPRLPRDVVRRPKKGFGIPISAWLRSMPAAHFGDRLPGMIGGSSGRLWQEHRAGRDHRGALWGLMAAGKFNPGNA